MKIKLTSVYVDEQERALRFYTDVLGFTKKADFSQGPFRWLTVASPEDPNGTELQLALNDDPVGETRSPAAAPRHGIEINGRVTEGVLSFELSFCESVYRPQTVKHFADGFLAQVRTFLDPVEAEDEFALTFSEAEFEQIGRAAARFAETGPE